MKIKKEKEFLYEMMREISQERRTLTNMYYDLMGRINALSKLEETGLTDLSTEGYFDLHNKISSNLSRLNQEREALHMFAETRQQVASQSEEVTIQNVQQEKPSIIPQTEIDRVKQIDKINKPKPTKRRSRHNPALKTPEALELVKQILIEKGTPMLRLEVYERLLSIKGLSEEEFTYKNFRGNVLTRLFALDEKLEKVDFDTIQYRL